MILYTLPETSLFLSSGMHLDSLAAAKYTSERIAKF